MAGRIAVEQPAALPWNQWPTCSGMGGRNGVESVAGMAWNTQVAIEIGSLRVLEGQIPPRALGLVIEWASQHKDELLANWKLAKSNQTPRKIEPLR
jgi:hypothetical protein